MITYYICKTVSLHAINAFKQEYTVHIIYKQNLHSKKKLNILAYKTHLLP